MGRDEEVTGGLPAAPWLEPEREGGATRRGGFESTAGDDACRFLCAVDGHRGLASCVERWRGDGVGEEFVQGTLSPREPQQEMWWTPQTS